MNASNANLIADSDMCCGAYSYLLLAVNDCGWVEKSHKSVLLSGELVNESDV